MRWEKGRQGTGYLILKLFQGKTWDCYLIDYPAFTSIPTHTDPLPGKKHFRLNILLKGEDKFRGETLYSSRRIKFFRPDIMPHSVEKVSRPRLILSIGWAAPL